MSKLVQLVGGKVIDGKAGSYKDVAVESLAGVGKVCGLYFASHSCEAFSSELVQWYKKFRAGKNGENVNLVFVSLDKNQTDFENCFDPMPWLALPFAERDKAAALSRRFEVHFPPFMPPTLVFVDANNGQLLARDGVPIVKRGTSAVDFPWKQTDLLELISGGNFLNSRGETKTLDSIRSESDFLGLYFSCRRCTPCQVFTRLMTEFYNRPKVCGKKYEVVFVSFDRDTDEFNLYLSEMPWWAFPFADHHRDPLFFRFFVKESPSVVIIDTKTGEVVSVNGYGGLHRDPLGKEFPWRPTPVMLLDESTTVDVNSRPSVIWLTDGSEDQVAQAKAALEPVATPYSEQHKNEDDSAMFFYTDPSQDNTGLSPIDYIALPSTRPLLFLVDNLQMCKYVCEATELNEQAVREFFTGFQAGSLKKMPLK